MEQILEQKEKLFNEFDIVWFLAQNEIISASPVEECHS